MDIWEESQLVCYNLQHLIECHYKKNKLTNAYVKTWKEGAKQTKLCGEIIDLIDERTLAALTVLPATNPQIESVPASIGAHYVRYTDDALNALEEIAHHVTLLADQNAIPRFQGCRQIVQCRQDLRTIFHYVKRFIPCYKESSPYVREVLKKLELDLGEAHAPKAMRTDCGYIEGFTVGAKSVAGMLTLAGDLYSCFNKLGVGRCKLESSVTITGLARCARARDGIYDLAQYLDVFTSNGDTRYDGCSDDQQMDHMRCMKHCEELKRLGDKIREFHEKYTVEGLSRLSEDHALERRYCQEVDDVKMVKCLVEDGDTDFIPQLEAMEEELQGLSSKIDDIDTQRKFRARQTVYEGYTEADLYIGCFVRVRSIICEVLEIIQPKIFSNFGNVYHVTTELEYAVALKASVCEKHHAAAYAPYQPIWYGDGGYMTPRYQELLIEFVKRLVSMGGYATKRQGIYPPLACTIEFTSGRHSVMPGVCKATVVYNDDGYHPTQDQKARGRLLNPSFLTPRFNSEFYDESRDARRGSHFPKPKLGTVANFISILTRLGAIRLGLSLTRFTQICHKYMPDGPTAASSCGISVKLTTEMMKELIEGRNCSMLSPDSMVLSLNRSGEQLRFTATETTWERFCHHYDPQIIFETMEHTVGYKPYRSITAFVLCNDEVLRIYADIICVEHRDLLTETRNEFLTRQQRAVDRWPAEKNRWPSHLHTGYLGLYSTFSGGEGRRHPILVPIDNELMVPTMYIQSTETYDLAAYTTSFPDHTYNHTVSRWPLVLVATPTYVITASQWREVRLLDS
jgi:hypothetical protein